MGTAHHCPVHVWWTMPTLRHDPRRLFAGWRARLHGAGRLIDDFGQKKEFDAVVFVLPGGFQPRRKRFEGGRLTQTDSLRFHTVLNEEPHRLLTALEAQLPMIAIR